MVNFEKLNATFSLIFKQCEVFKGISEKVHDAVISN